MLMINLFTLIEAVNHIYFEKLACCMAAMCGDLLQAKVRQMTLVVGLSSLYKNSRQSVFHEWTMTELSS